jgi:hypothetical protein
LPTGCSSPTAPSRPIAFIGSAFPSVTDVLGFLREHRLFRNLDGYDAMLVFDDDSGQLIQMNIMTWN